MNATKLTFSLTELELLMASLEMFYTEEEEGWLGKELSECSPGDLSEAYPLYCRIKETYEQLTKKDAV